MIKRIIPNTFTLSILSFAVNINTHIIEEKKTKLEMINIQSKNSIILYTHPFRYFFIYLILV